MTKPSKVLILDLSPCCRFPLSDFGEGAQAGDAFDVMLRGERSVADARRKA